MGTKLVTPKLLWTITLNTTTMAQRTKMVTLELLWTTTITMMTQGMLDLKLLFMIIMGIRELCICNKRQETAFSAIDNDNNTAFSPPPPPPLKQY